MATTSDHSYLNCSYLIFRNKWGGFYPYTNILWLDYLLKKLIFEKSYKNKRSKQDKKAMADLKNWHLNVLNYKSTEKFIYGCNIIQ